MFATQYFERPAWHLLYFAANNRPMVVPEIDKVGQVPVQDSDTPIFNHN